MQVRGGQDARERGCVRSVLDDRISGMQLPVQAAYVVEVAFTRFTEHPESVANRVFAFVELSVSRGGADANKWEAVVRRGFGR